MTEAKFVGNISPILYENWTDNTPSYYSYYDFHMKRKAAKKKLFKERVVFFMTMIAIICVTLSAFAFNSESRDTYDDNLLHCVEYGDTLWSIANTYKDEDRSTGEFVYEIKKVNEMRKSDINVGDLIIIPE